MCLCVLIVMHCVTLSVVGAFCCVVLFATDCVMVYGVRAFVVRVCVWCVSVSLQKNVVCIL